MDGIHNATALDTCGTEDGDELRHPGGQFEIS
jgi:hypothetical protein